MHDSIKRLSIWVLGIAILLLIPLVLTIHDGAIEGVGWNWKLGDFIFAFVVLFGSALTYELVAQKLKSTIYRGAVGLAVITGLLLIWINAAVGIIGEGDLDSPNVWYFFMLFLGFVSALIVRFEPRRMA